MQQEKTDLQKRIESGKTDHLSEIAPPMSSDPGQVRALAKHFSGKVHALGVSDNRDGVAMSALAAASIVASEHVEPILHMTTRDRNRTALIADFLGHGRSACGMFSAPAAPTRRSFRSVRAKNVFDIDATVLLQSLGRP